MSDKGIIFSAPMVRALLDGRKTQTRRLLTRSNTLFNGGSWPKGLTFADCKREEGWVDGGPSPAGNPGPYLKVDWPYGRLAEGDVSDDAERLMARLYPKVQPGDRLYVREAWSHTGQGVWDIATARMVGAAGVIYSAEGRAPGAKYWPSIHMPREFSRLTLIVTDVRVQQVAEISEVDAIYEGVTLVEESMEDPREAFEALWNSLHGKPGERWEDNPWIVAVSFDVKHGNIDRIGQ